MNYVPRFHRFAEIHFSQAEIAKKVTAELQAGVAQGKIPKYEGKTITTAIIPATKFYAAQDDHQAYLDKNPWGYCNHGYRFLTWPK